MPSCSRCFVVFQEPYFPELKRITVPSSFLPNQAYNFHRKYGKQISDGPNNLRLIPLVNQALKKIFSCP